MPGATVIEFGANWCSICQAATPAIAEAIAAHEARAPLRQLRVEDGRGRPLGRSFGVTLWPTLVALFDGKELGRVVRPRSTEDVAELLSRLSDTHSA